LARKTQQETAAGKRYKSMGPGGGSAGDQLSKLGAAGSKIAREEDMGLLAARVKDQVFNLKEGEAESREVEMKT
jgi:COP9 signalosome complex subunit 5